jgi:hypothetical protein
MARGCVEMAANDFCAISKFGVTSADGEDRSVQVVYGHEITMRVSSDAAM